MTIPAPRKYPDELHQRARYPSFITSRRNVAAPLVSSRRLPADSASVTTRFRQRTARLGMQVDVANIADGLETLDGPSVA